jgi:hypothetical protein
MAPPTPAPTPTARRRQRRMLVARSAAPLLLLLLTLLLAPSPAAAAAEATTNTTTTTTKTTHVDLRMPADYVTTGVDEYACTTVELPHAPHKVVAVEPLAEQGTVHHILLFGCRTPRVLPTKENPQPVWACRHVRACGGDAEVIFYGWGKNAPRLQLPPGVGYSVGGHSASDVRYVVAQVHYLQPKPKGDVSGVRLTLSPKPAPFSGGMISFASLFKIPPKRPSFLVPNACCYRGFQPLTAFAVRVHTHALGRGVSLVRHPPVEPTGGGVASSSSSSSSARSAGRSPSPELLAQGDPQAPQGFNPSPAKVLYPGDPITATCDFDSREASRDVHAGATHGDEMCNLYLMLYSPLPHLEMCADGSSLTDDRSPGNLPPERLGARFLPDPYPRWKPPALPDANPAAASSPSSSTANGPLGDVASVDLGPDGTLWALHRGSRRWSGSSFDPSTNKAADEAAIKEHVVVAMDPDTGAVKQRWGAGLFIMPHMLTVDPRTGHVWIADVGRHQVLKFSPQGELLLEIGERGVPGKGETKLCKPAQARALRDGGVVIADGYCNSRAVRFDAQGKYVQEYAIGGGQGWVSKRRKDLKGDGSYPPAGAKISPATSGYTVFAGDGESVAPPLAEARRRAAFRDARRPHGGGAGGAGVRGVATSAYFRGSAGAGGAESSGASSSRSAAVDELSRPMVVAHSVSVDECEGVVRVADREGRRIVAFDLDTGLVLGISRTKWPVWSLLQGPYGRTLALLFDSSSAAGGGNGGDSKSDAVLVDSDRPAAASWTLPGTAGKWPHDIALGAAPLALTGAGERLFALWSAPLCPERSCGPVLKHVLFPPGFGGPEGGVGDAMAAEARAGDRGAAADDDDDDDDEAEMLSYGALARPKKVAAHLNVPAAAEGEGEEGDGRGDEDATPEETAALREGLRLVADALDSPDLAGSGASEDFRIVSGGAGMGGGAGAGGSAGRLALIAAAVAAAAVVAASQVWGGKGSSSSSARSAGGRRGGPDDGFTTARYPPHRPVRTDDPDAAPLFKGSAGNSSSNGGGGGGGLLPPSDRRLPSM